MTTQQYRIISPRLGTPGDLWEPEIWVNIHALLDNGFIERVSDETSDTPKPKRTKVSKDKE